MGGYYDAGDHVKFGLPMAFTVTMLSWSLIEYGGDVADAGELGHALEAVKWGTDYFIKAHTRPDELWAEVRKATVNYTIHRVAPSSSHLDHLTMHDQFARRDLAKASSVTHAQKLKNISLW